MSTYSSRRTLLATGLFIAVFVASAIPIRVATAQANATCQGKVATIVYVGYESVVTGTKEDDVIYVEGGWNTVYADDGDDIVCTNGHFNTLFGGRGEDELASEGLYNELFGEDGDDSLIADDTGTLTGGAGENLCNGSSC